MFPWHQSKSKQKIFEWLILLSFQIVIFGSVKNDFRLIKKWMMLEIVDTSDLKTMALQNSLVLIWRFDGHNLKFCLLHMISDISVFCKITIRENFN